MFDDPAQKTVQQEYADTVTEAQERVARLSAQIQDAAASWSLRPVVEALSVLRGVDFLVVATVMAELGELRRFDSPRQLMVFLGLIPSEHSFGQRCRQSAITETGIAHARCALVELAWSYRHAARETGCLYCEGGDTCLEVQAIAWKAQKRPWGRYRSLKAAGIPA